MGKQITPEEFIERWKENKLNERGGAQAKRKKLGLIDDKTPEIAGQEPDSAYRKKCRANWAKLIQKIYVGANDYSPLLAPNVTAQCVCWRLSKKRQ